MLSTYADSAQHMRRMLTNNIAVLCVSQGDGAEVNRGEPNMISSMDAAQQLQADSKPDLFHASQVDLC